MYFRSADVYRVAQLLGRLPALLPRAGGGAEYIQWGVFLVGNWAVALSAYDRSGNESIRSDPLTVPMALSNGFNVCLPFLQR